MKLYQVRDGLQVLAILTNRSVTESVAEKFRNNRTGIYGEKKRENAVVEDYSPVMTLCNKCYSSELDETQALIECKACGSIENASLYRLISSSPYDHKFKRIGFKPKRMTWLAWLRRLFRQVR